MKSFLLALVALFALCGCTQEDVDRAEVAQQKAQSILDQARAAEAQATAALGQIAALAAMVDQAKGDALLARGTQALEMARDGVAAAQALVSTAGVGVDAAKKSHAAGGLTVEVVIQTVLALAAGLVPALGVLIPLINKYRTALKLTAAHGDSMERVARSAADLDPQEADITAQAVKNAKENARQSQLAAGVADLIAAARGKG